MSRAPRRVEASTERLRLAEKVLALTLAAQAGGCAIRASTPTEPLDNATLGHAPAGARLAAACGNWVRAMGSEDDTALRHDAFAELSPRACYVRVHHGQGAARPEPTPPGCGYPGDLERVHTELERAATHYERIARGQLRELPRALRCDLPESVRRHSAQHNAATLRELARKLAHGHHFPYAAVVTFGFGHRAMSESQLVSWHPGQACPTLGQREMKLLGVMRTRAGLAAEAYWGRVAPVVIVSGGAVHASLTEAHALAYLLRCRFSVPNDALLLDPCADHTHTNIRNAGSLVLSLGGRTAYLVTDEGLQGSYLQEWNAFHLIGGSIDQRSLRDWGYLLGAWRQASVGLDSGFWYTPYRFWADPEAGAGGLTCVE